MQREAYVLENEPFKLKIIADWDSESANYFTGELYKYVKKGNLSFDLHANRGSLLTEFVISIVSGIASAILYDLIKIIFNRLKRNRLNGKLVKPVHFFTFKEEYVITGDKDSKIPDDLKDELFR